MRYDCYINCFTEVTMKKIVCIILSLLMLASLCVTPAFAAETHYYELKAGDVMYISAKDTEIVSSSSSDPKVAKSDADEIIALTKGETTVTAKLKNGKTLNYKITVTTNPKIVGKKSKVEKIHTFRIYVKGAATKVKYSSSKPKIASITSAGEITSHKVGTTTITAKANGKTLSFKLKVYLPTIVHKYSKTFKKGYTYTLSYSFVGKNPKITSSNKKVVKVLKNGSLKARKKGKATITYTGKKAKAIVKITVK